jgi:L-alanine-DL-glutamate epimerase-like enolase superfamily enzyme
LKIDRIEARYLEVPLEGDFRPAWAPGAVQKLNRIVLVRVATDDGLTGTAATTAYAGRAAAISIDTLVTPYLLGKDPFALEEHIRTLRIAHRRGIFAWIVEAALWDIIGQACGQPIWKLLGGYRTRMPAYASFGEARSPGQRAEDTLRAREQGFRAVKLRIHSEKMADDIRQVEEVRKRVGDDFAIIVDANQATTVASPQPGVLWGYDRALRTARELERLGVVWLEEPLPMYDYEGLTRLCRDSVLPIAGGEANRGIPEFGRFIAERCYDIVQPDCTLSEGLLQLKKLQGMAEYHNVVFQPHTWTNGLGLAYNLHLCASSSSCLYLEYPYDPPTFELGSFYRLLAEPIRIDAEGNVALPERPGLGFELDEKAIRFHEVR